MTRKLAAVSLKIIKHSQMTSTSVQSVDFQSALTLQSVQVACLCLLAASISLLLYRRWCRRFLLKSRRPMTARLWHGDITPLSQKRAHITVHISQLLNLFPSLLLPVHLSRMYILLSKSILKNSVRIPSVGASLSLHFSVHSKHRKNSVSALSAVKTL